ncbi:MAG: rhomboid family intramembrane serine protease [Deltaproteobacteria bacterium]|nr:rhomboid family intramembrane serine protease [Deltaproteobacteria bacterium]
MTSLYKDNTFECKRINKSYDDAERIAFFYPLIGALIMPLLIGLFFPSILGFIKGMILLVICLIPSIAITSFVYGRVSGKTLREQISNRFSIIPAGLIYSNDLKMASMPWVTITLIILNSSIFFMVSPRDMGPFVLPPVGNHTSLDFMISIITSAFLHGSFWHLLGNMVFLWTFASALEPRIGTRRFITAYFLSMIVSSLVPITLLALQDSSTMLKNFHSLGASGAIAGIMGLFAVRCFFARVTVALPFILFPFISVPVRVNGILLCGLFFAFDISDSVVMFQGKSAGVNYWAHVGGFIFGIIMGYAMKLHNEASVESVSVKAGRLSRDQAGIKDATGLYTDLLKVNPSDESAMRYFLHLHRFNLKKAEPYFTRLMQVLIKKDFKQVLELFEDYYPELTGALPGNILLKIGMHYYKRADFKKARHCFEFAIEPFGVWNAKAMLQLGKTYEAIGNDEMAYQQYHEVIESFPDSVFAREAREEMRYSAV